MWALSLLGLSSAILVVTSTSTVFSVLWLITTFMITSLLLALLNLGFPSLLYVIVYIGAIAILFLFVVQLLDLNNSEETGIMNSVKSVTFTPLTILLVAALLASSSFVLLQTNYLTVHTSLNLTSVSSNVHSINSYLQISAMESFDKTNGIFSSNAYGTGDLFNIAEWLYGPGILPLLIISVILLISMVAPISLCVSKQ